MKFSTQGVANASLEVKYVSHTVFCILILHRQQFFYLLFICLKSFSRLSVYHLLFCSDCVYFSSLDVSSDFSLFEALRETIYSEVATLISQNESRPHFLIELFHELQLLNTDYLRQRALYSLQVQYTVKPVHTSTDTTGPHRRLDGFPRFLHRLWWKSVKWP